jgi:hypothetical protein
VTGRQDCTVSAATFFCARGLSVPSSLRPTRTPINLGRRSYKCRLTGGSVSSPAARPAAPTPPAGMRNFGFVSKPPSGDRLLGAAAPVAPPAGVSEEFAVFEFVTETLALGTSLKSSAPANKTTLGVASAPAIWTEEFAPSFTVVPSENKITAGPFDVDTVSPITTGNEVTPGAWMECPLSANGSALVTVATGFAAKAKKDASPKVIDNCKNLFNGVAPAKNVVDLFADISNSSNSL